MQDASNAYKVAMKKEERNHAYIRALLGVFNLEAQNSADVPDNQLTYYSNEADTLDKKAVDYMYATCEQGFTKTDGSMFFIPDVGQYIPYHQGLVSATLLGNLTFNFSTPGLRIMGLTIDFGEYYPTKFQVIYGDDEQSVITYENDSENFVTEDIYENTQYITIKPLTMVNGQGRLRIYSIFFGVGDLITNNQTTSFSWKENISSLTETLPSIDMSIQVTNYDGKYDVDDDNNIMSFMEVGQEIQIEFGYELDDGSIEWIKLGTVYLSSRDSNDENAKFVATDLFDSFDGTYTKGIYSTAGSTLWDLAILVLTDMGFEEGKYYLDPYLKDVIIHNPIPLVKHTEALQLIANAGRCVLRQDRNGEISMKTSFKPDITGVSSNSESYLSKVSNILDGTEKTHYAMGSKGFTSTQGNEMFAPDESDVENIENTGYISKYIADSDGNFSVPPEITIFLESSLKSFGFNIEFAIVCPSKITLYTYLDDSLVETIVIDSVSLKTIVNREFKEFDKLTIEFTKGIANSRVFVDNITFGEATDYTLTYERDLLSRPSVTRDNKLKQVACERTIYIRNDDVKELMSDTISAKSGTVYETTFSNPSYNFGVSFAEEMPEGITYKVIESSSYYIKLSFGNITGEIDLSFSITGCEFDSETICETVNYNTTGYTKDWSNPLVSDKQHAIDIAEWVGGYYNNPVIYDLDYRGDPRIDANDLFYLERQRIDIQMLRCYEHTLKFGGGWSGEIKGRRCSDG